MALGFTKAFNTFIDRPAWFVWSSFSYIFFMMVGLFSAAGLLLMFFTFSSLANVPLLNPSPTLPFMVFAILCFLFLNYLLAGFNGALIRAYRNSYNEKKTSLTEFFSNAVATAPLSFSLLLIRDLIWLIFTAPALFIYFRMLQKMEFGNIILAVFLIPVTFAIHMFFTPALISAGAGLENSLFGALRKSIRVFKEKHVWFAATYSAFAFVWLLGFIPVISIFSLFFLLPIIYSVLIVQVEESGSNFNYTRN